MPPVLGTTFDPANSVVELFGREASAVDNLIDLTLTNIQSADPALDPYFPKRDYETRELAMLRMSNNTPDIAYLVAEDEEIPLEKSSVALSLEDMGSLKVARGQLYLAKDFEMMFKIRQYRAMGQARAADALEDAYLAQPGQMTQYVHNTLYVLAIRVACTGVCAYSDPLTGLAPAALDYRSNAPAGNFPAPLTGNKRWSQSATATGINDLIGHLAAYYAVKRRYPKAIIMGLTEFTNLRMQRSTKLLVAALRGVTVDAANTDAIAAIPLATWEEMNQLISRSILGGDGRQAMIEFLVSDREFRGRNAAGIIDPQPYIPAGYYFFAEEGFIERATVPCIEKDFASGFYYANRVLNDAPRQERTVIVGNVLPLVQDPATLAGRNVENTPIPVPAV